MTDKVKIFGRQVPQSLLHELTSAIGSSENREEARVACRDILEGHRRKPYFGAAKRETNDLLYLAYGSDKAEQLCA
jgi:hypothetical protein